MVYSTASSSNIIKEQSNQEVVFSVMAKVSLSVIILKENEEKFTERCIRSVPWADEKLIINSGSADKTREIAASLGANIYEQEWLGRSAQRNKGISLAKNDWVFILEVVKQTPWSCCELMLAIVENALQPPCRLSVVQESKWSNVITPAFKFYLVDG